MKQRIKEIIFYISVFMIFLIVYNSEKVSGNVEDMKVNIDYKIENLSIDISIVNETKIEESYPKPTYTPTLRKYEIDKSDDIWHAKDSSSYITPENEWVQYYASQLFIDIDGRIKYKNEKIVQVKNLDGTLIYMNKIFVNDYVLLKEYFGVEIDNNDYWINADYYLTHDRKGICSSWAIALTSMLLSGEMSIKENNKFIKQIIPSKMILGYQGKDKQFRDGWVEYEAYEKKFFSTSGLTIPNQYESSTSYTVFALKEQKYKELHVIPIFEFTDKYFRRV